MKIKIVILILMMTLALMLCACSADPAVPTVSTAPATHNTSSMTSDSDSELEEVIRSYAEKASDSNNYTFRILECSEDYCTAEIASVYEYPTYIKTVFSQIELCKDTKNKPWRYVSRSYNVKYYEFDFSPLNGIWNATYSHSSTLLTEDDIPYTFTFANAGKIQIVNGVASTTTVGVQHGLDNIWSSFLAPEWAADYPDGVDYESGKMELRYEGSGGYFLITFDELNVDKMFSGPAQIRINDRHVTFYDTLIAKDCRLSR